MTDILILPYSNVIFSFVMLATFAAGEKKQSALSDLHGNAADDTLVHEDVWLSETSQIGNL